VVLAVPATPAARLLAGIDLSAAAEIETLTYASVALASFALPPSTALPELSGFLVPPSEGTLVKAATFVTRKWTHLDRADGDDEDLVEAASAIAAIPSVRTALVDKQLSFRRLPGLVADGRDMGTVIFPDAGVKVFLTASAEERAKRRYKQLKDKGLAVTLASLLREIEARDARDAARPVAPLKPALDAVLIDSTGMPVDAVVDKVLSLIQPA